MAAKADNDADDAETADDADGNDEDYEADAASVAVAAGQATAAVLAVAWSSACSTKRVAVKVAPNAAHRGPSYAAPEQNHNGKHAREAPNISKRA